MHLGHDLAGVTTDIESVGVLAGLLLAATLARMASVHEFVLLIVVVFVFVFHLESDDELRNVEKIKNGLLQRKREKIGLNRVTDCRQ